MAKVIRDNQDYFDPSYGPHGFNKVGVEICGKVFWIGSIVYPNSNHEQVAQFEADEQLAHDIVHRLHGEAVKRSEW